MDNTMYKDPLLFHLVDAEILDEGQAIDISEEHVRTGRSVRNIILDNEVLDEEQVLSETAAAMGTSVIHLEDYDIGDDTLASFPASTARMYTMVPVSGDSTSLTLAAHEYVGPEVSDEIRFVLSQDIEFVVAPEQEIRDFIDTHYGDNSDSMVDMLAALEDAGGLSSGLEDDEDLGDEHAANSAPVVRFVNLVLFQAVQGRASDIHFEPFADQFKIRYRVDGALYEMAPPPKHLAMPVISRVKVISGLDISERRLPQDGRIQLNIGGNQIDFRVSTLPTQHGESVVLRVLDQSNVGLELENLGFPDDVYNWFAEDIEKPNGIVVVTGPTGSGKTTTLYSGLRRINKIEVKILTAEEPVEYDVEGIIQIGINDQIDVTFARVLRAFLRQDPDVILVGEIRDMETAQIAIQASLTGHLVFSTLHTNDAAGAITRMVDMGVEPFLIASTLEAIMGTRLVRTICSKCKESYQPDDDIIKSLGLKKSDVGEQPFFVGRGCDQCNQTGYHGRRGIYEYLRVSGPIRDLIIEQKPTLVIRERARELGMRTLREDGVRCVLDGYTTVDEILKYT